MNPERHAQELHDSAVVIDGHSDILVPITEGKMKLGDRVEMPDPGSWQPPLGLDESPLVQFGFSEHTAYFGPMGQYDIPRFIEGGITAQVCAIYLDDEKLGDPLFHGLQMTWHLHNSAAADKNFELVKNTENLLRLKKEGKVGGILSFEGCEALGSEPRFLDLYYKLGLRIASLTHTRGNIFAEGCYSENKDVELTEQGKQLIRQMNRLGIVVDLAHINQGGFWDILEITNLPVILSHSTPTMFPNTNPNEIGPLGGKIPRPRLELPRDRPMLEAIAENGGVLGLIWVCHADIADVVRDIETALGVMGPDHIGLGSDLYGLELAPRGLEDISKTPLLTKMLVQRGHEDETILKFLGGNYLRVFEQVWHKDNEAGGG